VQAYHHYTGFPTETHTDEDIQPKDKFAQAHGWAGFDFNFPIL
jgi:hypothetical protein